MKSKIVVAIDLDNITVEMVSNWIRVYNQTNPSGEVILEEDIVEYDISKFCLHPEHLHEIIEKDGYFFHLNPIINAVEFLPKIYNDSFFETLIVTQPPRKSDYAVRDKRLWVQKHFPNFPLRNMIFCHRKEFIQADVFFDDSPDHILHWKGQNPAGIACTIDYNYNKGIAANYIFKKETAWKNFYELLQNIKRN